MANKPTLFTDFLAALEEKEDMIELDENFEKLIHKMGIIGACDTIEVFAKAAKSTMSLATTIPSDKLRMFLNAIVNTCAIIEKAINLEENPSSEDPLKYFNPQKGTAKN